MDWREDSGSQPGRPPGPPPAGQGGEQRVPVGVEGLVVVVGVGVKIIGQTSQCWDGFSLYDSAERAKIQKAARKTAPPSSEGQGGAARAPWPVLDSVQRPAVAAGRLAGKGEAHAHVGPPGAG